VLEWECIARKKNCQRKARKTVEVAGRTKAAPLRRLGIALSAMLAKNGDKKAEEGRMSDTILRGPGKARRNERVKKDPERKTERSPGRRR